jgi:2-amino-4-hydroxy-6-hydroxymethyldihydropteridine diphosphokinase
LARAFLSLGSNVAGAVQQIDEADRRIGLVPGTRIIGRSADRHAAAERRQRRCLYRLVGVVTTIKPRALLDLALNIEASMGRDHADVWGPRLIDIDLIAYDDIEIRSSRLHLPHPFAHSRPHILEPLRELAPDAAAFIERVGRRPR